MKNTFDTPLHAKVLIVDDDPMMRLIMRESLENEHYEILETDNGESALECIKDNPPDIVLLDVKMPGMSGFDVCSEIRKNYNENTVSIVVVTGLDDAESIEQAFEVGATAFINKPINPVTFPYRIQYLLSARNTFLSLKQSETHLDYMDRISRIFSHKKDIETLLHETLKELLDIFKADKALFLKSNGVNKNKIKLVASLLADSQQQNKQPTTDFSFNDIPIAHFVNARISEYPVITQLEATENQDAQFFMTKALFLNNDEHWYIVLQRSVIDSFWSSVYKETFYRINIRLSSVLSSHLLLKKLHESEALLKQAQKIGRLGNWSINFKTGDLYWSDEIYHIYDLAQNTFTPGINALQKNIVDEDRERVMQFEHNAFFSGVTESIEYRIKLPNNDIRWVHKQGIATVDSDGNIITVNGTLQDITERILKQEQELHDHKMEAVGQLTSGVAHDFGNLMTIARGNLELLDESFFSKYKIQDDDKEIISDAKSAVRDSVDLTKQLLTFSRKKSLSPKNLNIQKAIGKFHHLLTKTLGDCIPLNIKVQQNLPDIFVNVSQFESSLLNAIINAKHAMPTGGNLTIHVKKHKQLPSALAKNTEHALAENYICISIADTGKGMPAEVLTRATEPFFTTKKNEGTGLGLSMIYGFMRQSNGFLSIESKVNQGTCLLMFFPASNKTLSTKKASMINPSALPITETKTILIVEDREPVRRFAIRCLNHLPLNILQANNAQDAINILNASASIDLLFSDILMPGKMSGRDLAIWVNQYRPEIKVLLTTASERESGKSSTHKNNDFQVLPKPYSQEDLLAEITKLLHTSSIT